jgi:hypothetical protein
MIQPGFETAALRHIYIFFFHCKHRSGFSPPLGAEFVDTTVCDIGPFD